MKKIAVFMSLVLMLFSMPLTTYAESVAPCAASAPPATPNWKLGVSVTSGLVINGTDATCFSIVAGASSVTSITVEQYLQKEGFLWIYYSYDADSEWETTVSGNTASIYNYKSGLTSGKYRLKTIATLKTASGQTETITSYSDPVEI
ncbi:MAG: hypothetical protein J1F03_02835 [Oscillospiraceae bacterium]|nr:hypothetical protein [Oscillospiraceae bacterium]